LDKQKKLSNMKTATTLGEQFRYKFDEMPVPGHASGDWKKLKKALQMAMPVSFLPAALFGKVWLSKKFLWLYLAAAGVGGGSTALVVYSSRSAGLVPSVSTAKHHNLGHRIGSPPAAPKSGPKLPKSKSIPVVIAKDTLSASDTVRTMRNRKSPPRVARDTSVRRVRKTSRPLRDTVSRAIRNRKSPPRLERDTTVKRARKTSRPARDTINIPVRTRKSPPRITRDTTVTRARKTPRPIRDTTNIPVRKRKSLPRVIRDTTTKQRKAEPPAGN
jgi:hypothetical protein